MIDFLLNLSCQVLKNRIGVRSNVPVKIITDTRPSNDWLK